MTSLVIITALALILLGVIAWGWRQESKYFKNKHEESGRALILAQGEATQWKLRADLNKAIVAEFEQRQQSPPPETVPWTEEDRTELTKFYHTPTGKRFVLACGGQANDRAMREAKGDSGCPTAAGFDALLRFQWNLQAISRPTGAQVETPGNSELNDTAHPLRSF